MDHAMDRRGLVGRARAGLWLPVAIALGLALAGPLSAARAAELWIGAATADITPDRPVPLPGNRTVRIAREILSRCTANALALESRQGDRVLDQAILVSCDLCVIRPGIQDGFRKHVAGRLPGFDINKLFLAATHTHAAPVLLQDRYDEKDYGDAMQPKEYVPFMYERMAEAVEKAWKTRSVGAVAWGLGHAVAGRGRRAFYADGTAKMYGKADTPDFRGVEGYEDHGVHVLCFYDAQKQLKAAAITLACTAQAGGTGLNADYWHDVRELLHARHGKDLCVLGFCAPAGDMATRPIGREKGEARMRQLRGLTPSQELGRRVAAAFDDVAPVIAKDIRTDVPLIHRVRQIELPARIITEAEYAASKKICDEIDTRKTRLKTDCWTRHFHGLVVARYLAQQKGGWKTYPVELHVLRLGDVAIATNPFELYVSYGVQIQARSPAQQTMLIQLASTGGLHGYYVPTPQAVAGGGYSAEVTHNMIGPDGAQVLVDQTVQAIKELFPNAGAQ